MATAERTNAQKFKIAAWQEVYDSVVIVQRNYRKEFGINSNIPDAKTVKRLHFNCLEFGTVNYSGKEKAGRPKTSRSLENISAVENKVLENPKTSVRRLAANLDMSKSTVQRILKGLNLTPYKPKILHKLHEEDLADRVQFSEDFLEILNADPEILKLIMFSDEANFHINGAVNRHNCRYWSQEPPEELHETPLHSPKVVVWCAFWSGGVIGPFFFSGNVDGDSYLAMLKDYFIPEIEDYDEYDEVFFMQDGAPPHFKKDVRQFLSQKFPERVIGRGCDIPWPARSPDLTPCDFFLWGYLKQIVYSEPIQDLEHLKQRIRGACGQVTAEMRAKVLLNFRNRLEKVIENAGGHIE